MAKIESRPLAGNAVTRNATLFSGVSFVTMFRWRAVPDSNFSLRILLRTGLAKHVAAEEILNVLEVKGLGDGIVVAAVGKFAPDFRLATQRSKSLAM